MQIRQCFELQRPVLKNCKAEPVPSLFIAEHCSFYLNKTGDSVAIVCVIT